MRIQIRAIGTSRNTHENALIETYLKRLTMARSLGISEVKIDDIKPSKPTSKNADAEKLLARLPTQNHLIALDETGKNISSIEFADYLQNCLRADYQDMIFLIGGADGLDDTIHQNTDFTLSLGRMTYPHALAKLLLVEQLFRAVSILTNHPYHRE